MYFFLALPPGYFTGCIKVVHHSASPLHQVSGDAAKLGHDLTNYSGVMFFRKKTTTERSAVIKSL